MTGGSRIIDFRRSGADGEAAAVHAAAEAGAQPFAEPETAVWEPVESESPGKGFDRIAAGLAIALALGWIVLVGWTSWTELGRRLPDPAESAAILAQLSAPLALIGVLYLLLMRGSRSEARRFTRTSAAMRAESTWLEAVLQTVSTRIEENRIGMADQTAQLLTIGEAAALRMRDVGAAIRGDVEILAQHSDALKSAATVARANLSVLMSDLPGAQVQTRELADDLKAIGATALQNAGALQSQLASLAARGHEADEIAGGAAQRLSTHLARIEGTSDAAAIRLEGAAGQMTAAVDQALARAADAVDEARKGMEAQGAAMLAMIEQSQAALAHTGEEASATLHARIRQISAGMADLGASLTVHETASLAMADAIQAAFADVEARMAVLDATGTQRTGEMAAAIGELRGQADQMTTTLQGGTTMADLLIQKSEALLTALDANARELDETIPAALERLDARATQSRELMAAMQPEAEKLEMTAISASNRLAESEQALLRQRETLGSLIAEIDRRIADTRASVTEVASAIGLAGEEATRFAELAAPQLLDALIRVRETAMQAAERAKDNLARIIPDTAAALAGAMDAALGETLVHRVEAQMAEMAASAERAVEVAHKASDRLMRQMLTIAETNAQVEARIDAAHEEVRKANSDGFSHRVALLIESLNSTAIDVGKVLSNDAPDSAWAAYLKGDRGVFTRRAVRLLDAGEVREIARHYDEEPDFREQVNRYIHDFESMLRTILAARDGSPLGVTILSSDMGKLYVALAQAIERLRS